MCDFIINNQQNCHSKRSFQAVIFVHLLHIPACKRCFRQMKLLYMRSIKEPGGILSDVSAVFIPDHPDLIELSRCATQGAIRPLSLPRKFQTPFPARPDPCSRYRIRHQKNWSWRKLGSLIREPEKLPLYSPEPRACTRQ